MVNNVYDLVTRTMEQEFPGRVAFRWVEDATGTVKEKDLCRVCTGYPPRCCLVCPEHPGGGGQAGGSAEPELL